MSKKILIVEDEASIRELYTDVLVEAGYEIEQISDGELALQKINEGNWDLLLLDIMLPSLDGTAILGSVKKNPMLKDKPVVIVSNLDADQIIKECLENGAKDYLVKSNITPHTVLEIAHKYLPHDNPNDQRL